jgi:carboxyl-terminal processing protease
VLARRFGYPVVVSAIAGSPAAVAGVKSDDVIEKIDDKPARSLALWEAEALFSGRAGGRVHLLVVREGKPRRRTIDFVRSSWVPERPSAARVEGEIVVKIPAFTPGTASSLKTLLVPYDRTRAMILDLRGNALGSFDEAARSAALFVPPGPLGELKGRKIDAKPFRSEAGERVHESRLVLLVDSGTAGAAELFCSAIRDAATRESAGKPPSVPSTTAKPDPHEDPRNEGDGAEIAHSPSSAGGGTVRLVGETTFGMGFTAQVVKLASGGAVKLSVGKIHTSSGRSLSPKGIDPDDRVFALPPDDSAQTPAVDPVLQRGLKALAELTAKTTTKAAA